MYVQVYHSTNLRKRHILEIFTANSKHAPQTIPYGHFLSNQKQCWHEAVCCCTCHSLS